MVKEGDLLTREVPVISDEVNELKNECNYKFSFDDEATIQNYFLSENKKFLLHSNGSKNREIHPDGFVCFSWKSRSSISHERKH